MEGVYSAAIRYVFKGFSVIPVQTSGNWDKKPSIKWKHYQDNLPSIEDLQGWFANESSNGIGIVTGEVSGLTVVDADSDEAVRLIIDTIGDLKVPTVSTPRGGKHFYFRYIPGTNNIQDAQRDKDIAIDIRSEGGYVIAPPTLRGGGMYSWDDELSIWSTDIPECPSKLMDLLYSKSKSKYNNYISTKGPSLEGPITNSKSNTKAKDTSKGTVSNISTNGRPQGVSDENHESINASQVYQGVDPEFLIQEGTRDHTLFHIANCLIKGGMESGNAKRLMIGISQGLCAGDFPEWEARQKVDSVMSRVLDYKNTWKDGIMDVLNAMDKGTFLQTMIYTELGATSRNEKAAIRNALNRMSKDSIPIIAKTGIRAGEYEKLAPPTPPNNWRDSDDDAYDIDLPFGLSGFVDIYPGDVILVAGGPDAGKTVTMLATAKLNDRKHLIKYWSTEVSPQGLKVKLSKDTSRNVDDWNLEHRDYEGPTRIDPDGFNIIDYLEVLENPHMVAAELKQIHTRLKGGIAVCCIQKDPRKKTAWGGFMSEAKPMLAINLDKSGPGIGKVTVRKAKNTPIVDITGFEATYRIINAAELSIIENFHKIEPRRVV